MLTELRKVIPSFLKRVDLTDRGVAASTYLATTRASMEDIADKLFPDAPEPDDGPSVELVEFDPDAEVRLVTAMLYPYTDQPESVIEAKVRVAARPTTGWRSCGRTSATAPTAGTGPGGPSSARCTASTCSPTTGPSATSSATGC